MTTQSKDPFPDDIYYTVTISPDARGRLTATLHTYLLRGADRRPVSTVRLRLDRDALGTPPRAGLRNVWQYLLYGLYSQLHGEHADLGA